MQLELLILLQSIASPVLDTVAEVLSVFGEILVPILISSLIYWCVSKKKGFTIAFSILSSITLANFIKALVRFPRPFVRHPELISGKRLETATGYSFPSGHATVAASTYPGIARAFPRRSLKVLSMILAIAVCLSRMYLGVHWPLDVATGFVLGLSVTIIISPLIERLWDDLKAFSYFTLSAGAVALILGLVLAFMLDEGLCDYTAWSDLCTMLATMGALLLGSVSERRLVGFDASSGGFWKKLLRTLSGIATTAVVFMLVSMIPLSHKLSTFATMSVSIYWVVFVYPLIGRKLRLF